MRLLFLSALLINAACGKAKTPRQDLVALEVGEVTSLDPVYPYDAVSQSLILNVYDTLIAFEGDSLDSFIPSLATKVPSVKNGLISKDGLTYRFPIRKGVRFHDGSKLTPEDARYSILRFMLTDRAGGPSALLLEPILGLSGTRDKAGKIIVDFKDAAKAVRVDGGDVVIRLKRPFGPFLSIMARWSYVTSKSWAAAHGEWDGTAANWKKFNNPDKLGTYFFDHMNGAGPFMLSRWDRTARYVLLTRFEDYWRGPAKSKRVLIKAVPEFSTRKLMLQAGDADFIDTPRSFVSQVDRLKGVRVIDNLPRLMTDPTLFFTMDINPRANPDIGSGKFDGKGIPVDFFKDKDLRKGFAYAFDYQALIRDTFKGSAVRAKGPVPPGLFGYDAGQPYYTYDLKKAEKHLRRAWGGKVWEKGFRFTLTFNVGSENRLAACQILKKNLESLNPRFQVDLRGLEWGSYLDRAQKKKLPMFSRGWTADYPDAHNFVHAYYHSAGRYPRAQGYENPEMDRLIDAAVAEARPKKRAALYRKILRLGFEEVPSIVTIHPSGVRAMSSKIDGFYDNAVHMGIYFYPLSRK